MKVVRFLTLQAVKMCVVYLIHVVSIIYCILICMAYFFIIGSNSNQTSVKIGIGFGVAVPLVCALFCAIACIVKHKKNVSKYKRQIATENGQMYSKNTDNYNAIIQNEQCT